jgi:hypothetical protein
MNRNFQQVRDNLEVDAKTNYVCGVRILKWSLSGAHILWQGLQQRDGHQKTGIAIVFECL